MVGAGRSANLKLVVLVLLAFINMVITRVKNWSPDMIVTAFDPKLHEEKMRYLPGFVDLICIKNYNTGNLRVDIKHKMVINGVPGGPHGSEFGMYLITIYPNIFLYPKDPNFN